MAAYKLGAIAVPLAALFGPRCAPVIASRRSGVKAIVTDAAGAAKLAALRDDAAGPRNDPLRRRAGRRRRGLARGAGTACASPSSPVDTAPDDPALMIFTSGTTGPPKGAVHGHRVLLRPSPRLRLHPRVLPAGGDAALDAIRLGLGRRPPQCAPSRPLFRRPRGLRPVPPLRPGGGLRADGRSRRQPTPSCRRRRSR